MNDRCRKLTSLQFVLLHHRGVQWGEDPMANPSLLNHIRNVNNNSLSQSHYLKLTRSSWSDLPSSESQDANGFAPRAEEVATRAYFNYVNEGLPQGRDVQHWLDAEAELVTERTRARIHGNHN